MASQLDTASDAPIACTDSNLTSQSMMTEVSQDRASSKTSDPPRSSDKSTDQASAVLGNLTLVDDTKNVCLAGKDDAPGQPAKVSDSARDAAPAGENSAAGDAVAKSTGAESVAAGDATAKSAGAESAAAGDVATKNLAAENAEARLPVASSIFSIFDSSPSADDKQALRDLSKKVRDKVSEDLEPEKKAKIDTLAEGIKDEKAKEQFKRDIDTVEHRNPPISKADRGRLYSQVEKLMEAGDNPSVPLNAEDRSKLAQEIMHKTADPTSIDQGIKGTCNVATVEARTFTRDPAAAAKVIVDVATSGEYTAPDGTRVKPDPGSIKPDIEVRNPSGIFKNPRDHADQIFQVTAVNAAWQTHDLQTKDGRTYPKGTVEYRQTDPKTGEENGEGLYDKSKNPPEPITEGGKPITDPHLNGNQITDVANLISGRDDKDFVIEHGGPNAADKTFKVNSEAELKEKLKSMKEHGELPAIVMVNTGNQPFWGENIKLSPGFIPAKTVNGEHVVTITDYDEKTGLVSLDNQWGKGRDHIGGSGISTGDLYVATMPPGSKETINILERDVKWNRDHNTVNTSKEIELLQQKNAGGQLSDGDYKTQLDQTMEDARKRWIANGTREGDVERQQAEEYYAKINKSKEVINIVHMQTN